ncbi:MAG: hypothetical protein ACI9KE_006182 [Polyangiales bacterium]|jgi:hypothetical protein
MCPDTVVRGMLAAMASKHSALTLLLSLVGLIGLTPSVAEACACCDGHAERTVVGWSASGQTALVNHRSFGCVDTHSLELLRAGQAEPVGCFDVYSARPDRRVDCASLTPGYDRFPPEGRPTSSPRVADYSGAAQQVDAAHVRATLHRFAATEDESLRVQLRVEVRAGGRWTEVHRQEVQLGRPEHGADIGDLPESEQRVAAVPQPVEVHIWPSPQGQRGLVEVGGYNVDPAPGIGLYSETMHWVHLPEGVVLSSGGPNLSFAAADASLRRIDWMNQAAARRVNRLALSVHARGEFEASARLFATALTVAPNHVGAQYNLACAYARLSQADEAVALLQALADRGCSRCRQKLVRAQQDPDLAAIRPRLPTNAAE